jgi:hypothetical protein
MFIFLLSCYPMNFVNKIKASTSHRHIHYSHGINLSKYLSTINHIEFETDRQPFEKSLLDRHVFNLVTKGHTFEKNVRT